MMRVFDLDVRQEKKKANAIMSEVLEKRAAAAASKLVTAPWDRQ